MPAITPQWILDEMVRDYLGGMSANAVADKYGRSCAPLYRELRRCGVKTLQKTPQVILDEMVADYVGGMSAKDAAAKHGKDTGTCLNEMKRRGIKVRKHAHAVNSGRKKTPRHILDVLVQSYMNGSALKKACEPFGVDASVCRQELIRRGIPRRRDSSTPSIPAEQEETLKSLYRDGKTVKEIAEITGHSLNPCYRVLREVEKVRRESCSIRISAARQGVSVEDWKGYSLDTWKLFACKSEYKAWRKLVFKRDGYTCADCGKRGSYIQAHHIFRKSLFPHLALVVENGVTLCKECHLKIRHCEEKHAARYLAKIGSTIAPIVFYESRADAEKDTSN